MKSFREFIIEKPISTPESGVGYISNVPRETAKELISRAEKKKSAQSRYFDATDDATRAGAETSGKGSSGRSGSEILKGLIGEPPKGKPTSKLTGNKGRISGSLSKGNLKFSGDTNYKEMLAKMPNAPKKNPRVGPPIATTRVVKQADVSKDIAQQTTDYKTKKGEEAYKKTAADIDARRSFPTGKGGLKADERNPYVKREVRQARAAKLGGDIFDLPKETNRPFKGQGAKPTKTTYPSFFKPSKPDIQPAKTGAPERASTRQAVRDLRNSASRARSVKIDILGTSKKEIVPVSKPTKLTTSSASSGYSFENKPKAGSEIVVARKSMPPVNLGRKGQSYDPLKKIGDIVRKGRTSSPTVSSSGLAIRTPSLPAKQDVIDVKVREIKPEKPKQFKPEAKPQQPKSQAQAQPKPQTKPQDIGKTFAKEIEKSKSKSRMGTGALLGALGAAQEYKVGQAKAKKAGYGKLGQVASGLARGGGALAGSLIGTAVGGRVAGGVGALGGGAYGYSKGAKLGTAGFEAIAKSPKGKWAANEVKWLGKKAKQLVPGAFK